jgi:hypothetical protein
VTKWWHVSWKRVALALTIVFGTLALLAWTAVEATHQLLPWLMVRHVAQEHPDTTLAVSQLPLKNIDVPDGVQIAFHGFSFQVPWKDVEMQSSGQSYLLMVFGNGTRILIQDPPSVIFHAKLLRSDPQFIRSFGTDTLRSDYDLMAAEMAANPDQAAWWKTPRQNANCLFLLGEKGMDLHGATVAYAVNLGEVRGFQAGSPSVAPYEIYLDLFDSADRHYQIWIRTRQNSASVLSQAEVNGMVASLKPGPSPENKLVK